MSGLALAGLFSGGLAETASPANAVAGGIIVPAGGDFEPNNANGTFTYTYATIAVAPEAEADEPETPACAASGATVGPVGLTSFTFNKGTTVVRCTAPEDGALPDNVPDTGTFTVTVEPRPVFDPPFNNEPLSFQNENADGTDTATFTTPVTAHEPGEPSETISVNCNQTVSPFAPLTFPVILGTGGHFYFCTATDTTDNPTVHSGVTIDLAVLDERTVLSNPGNQTATADATDTAFVSYPTVTPTETPSGEKDNTIAGCFPSDPLATSGNFFASSGTFNVGVTTLTCDGNDIPNAPGKDGTNPPGESAPSITFTVTVADQPVTLTVPPDQVVDATSPAGATVTYTPRPVTATEDGEAAETIQPTCTVDNGATSGDGFISAGNFPIGDTTVTCTAADTTDAPSATPVSSSFTVHVKGAAEQLADLYQAVQGVGPGTSLADKVRQAESLLASGDVTDACATLVAFIHEVHAQSGGKIPTSQADQLIAAAKQVRAVLGC